MKNRDLLRFLKGLNAVGSLQGVKFAYAVGKNRRIVEREVETLQEADKDPEEYEPFNTARIELCQKHCKKNDDGNPFLVNENYIIQTQKPFDAAMKKLVKKHQEVVDAREQQTKEYDELLKEDSDFKPFMLSLEHVPDDITPGQLGEIIDMIEENGYFDE